MDHYNKEHKLYLAKRGTLFEPEGSHLYHIWRREYGNEARRHQRNKAHKSTFVRLCRLKSQHGTANSKGI